MSRFARAFAIACCFAPSAAISQEIASITAEPAEIGNGQVAEISIEFKPPPQSNNTDNSGPPDWRCGLIINYGDGKSEFHRIDVKQTPYKVTHKYDAPGNYAVTIEGKTQLQGLRLTLPCLGSNRSVAIIVRPDDFAAREAAERAAKEDALKRAAADREAAERAADKAKRDRAAAERSSQKAAIDRVNAAKGAAAARATAESKPIAKPEEKKGPVGEAKPAPAPAKARSAMEM